MSQEIASPLQVCNGMTNITQENIILSGYTTPMYYIGVGEYKSYSLCRNCRDFKSRTRVELRYEITLIQQSIQFFWIQKRRGVECVYRLEALDSPTQI